VSRLRTLALGALVLALPVSAWAQKTFDQLPSTSNAGLDAAIDRMIGPRPRLLADAEVRKELAGVLERLKLRPSESYPAFFRDLHRDALLRGHGGLDALRSALEEVSRKNPDPDVARRAVRKMLQEGTPLPGTESFDSGIQKKLKSWLGRNSPSRALKKLEQLPLTHEGQPAEVPSRVSAKDWARRRPGTESLDLAGLARDSGIFEPGRVPRASEILDWAEKTLKPALEGAGIELQRVHTDKGVIEFVEVVPGEAAPRRWLELKPPILGGEGVGVGSRVPRFVLRDHSAGLPGAQGYGVRIEPHAGWPLPGKGAGKSSHLAMVLDVELPPGGIVREGAGKVDLSEVRRFVAETRGVPVEELPRMSLREIELGGGRKLFVHQEIGGVRPLGTPDFQVRAQAAGK